MNKSKIGFSCSFCEKTIFLSMEEATEKKNVTCPHCGTQSKLRIPRKPVGYAESHA